MSPLDGFKFLAINAPYQLYRYGLNWDHQSELGPDAVQFWEATEPGSLSAVMQAYAFVVPLIESKTPFTLNHIQTIHQYCTKNVHLDTANLDKSVVQAHAGLFRGFGPWVGTLFGCFGIEKSSRTPAGLKELLQAHQMADCHCETPYQMIITRPDQIDAELERANSVFLVSGFRAGFSWEDLNNLQDNIERENKIIAAQNQSMAPPSRLTLREREALTESINSELARWRHNLIIKLESVLNEFYNQINALPARPTDEKLSTIVRCIQRLERIHPFWDGNLRTFCMVLLNALLMQHDFEPTILSNPSQFDGFSLDESIGLVRDGMKRSKLIRDYVRNSPDTSDISTHTPINFPSCLHVPNQLREVLIDFASPLIRQLNQSTVSNSCFVEGVI